MTLNLKKSSTKANSFIASRQKERNNYKDSWGRKLTLSFLYCIFALTTKFKNDDDRNNCKYLHDNRR